MAKMMKQIVLIAASAILALGLLACGDAPVSDQPVPEPSVGRTVVAVAATPSPTSAVVSPVPTPTSAGDKEFAAQRTRMAPTSAAIFPTAVRLVNKTGTHHQWKMATSTANAQIRAQSGLAGGQVVNDGKGQQYTCIIHEDGTQIPRINLAFRRGLTNTVITNQFGELQGAVSAVTTVAGVATPVEWRTWPDRVDRIRLREDDAVRFVQALDDQDASEFKLGAAG